MKVLAFDIGGTNIKYGLVENGSIREILSTSTKSIKSFEQFIQVINEIIGNFKDSYDFITFAVAGLINIRKNEILLSPNIPFLKNADLEVLRNISKVPVQIENDANAYALGEWWYGAGERRNNVIVLTLGTGVGGGIIANGKLLKGFNGYAGEIGHMIIYPEGPQCKCGQRGCLESFIGGDYFPRYAEGVFKLRNVEVSKLTMKKLYKLASEGDEIALYLFKEYGKLIGIALVSLINILDPEIIVFGGKISQAFEMFKPGIEEVLSYKLMRYKDREVELRKAVLGDKAALLGGELIARNVLR